MGNIFAELNANSHTQAVAYAGQLKLIGPEKYSGTSADRFSGRH